MTTAIAELCGHRWDDPSPIRIRHRCERDVGHQRDMLLRQPQQCRCRCGATTREDT